MFGLLSPPLAAVVGEVAPVVGGVAGAEAGAGVGAGAGAGFTVGLDWAGVTAPDGVTVPAADGD